MQSCVIYARVSTKEQQAEGYSIPAQLKAIREFCAREKLSPVAEFIEAESAGKAGRTQFGLMLAYLASHPEVAVVVAHKLDRLYRNFRDQITLDDLGVRARCVIGDTPETPQGELMRDVNLSFSKFYLENLREEVKKGMDEKVAQGGWPHKAPSGYLNDRATRSLVPDPERSPLVRYAFERYATGAVSLSTLASELADRGFTSRSGARVGVSALHTMLKNPIYSGVIRYKGKLYPGTHEPIITPELFEAVQDVFEPNRNGVKSTKHVFALRDFLTCSECGCKITAERQRGHAYYRCTHGKGKDSCSQSTYAREEKLSDELASILASIEITPDIIAALVADSEALDAEIAGTTDAERSRLQREIALADGKAGRLLDAFLDGTVEAAVYHAKAEELSASRRTFERRLWDLENVLAERTSQVRALAETAASARFVFETADTQGKRQVLDTVLSNATLDGGSIASYQLKRPFEYLRRDPKGAFYHPWWALEDLNL